MRKSLWLKVIVVALLVSLGAGQITRAQDTPTLYIYNWTTYFAEDTLSNFEKQNNVKIVLDTYASNEELFAKLQAGNPGYDLIFPSDYMVQQMLATNMLESLDLTKLPNYTANVDARFTNPPYDPNNDHCVAYQWGTVGIGYNLKRTGQEIKGWKDVFQPKFAKRVSLVNNARDVLVVGLFATGKDPNSVEQADLEAARDFILANKEVIAAFHNEDGQVQLLRGDVDITLEYSGDIYQVMEEDEDIRYVIPEEGSTIWVDNLCIPVGAKNKELAEQFINYIYEPQVAADISNFTYYATPNKAAIDQKLIDEEAMNDTNIYPTEDMLKHLVFLTDIGDAQTLYDEFFADIKASVGQ
ncbi:MAG: spermidine/putrescine ABC transporter substrate-binding protein [Anaerolineae bacterium]|nr:spermidine/putrescine ABC transporter substrate-binding protein [Anaerolineae bacterium]